MWSRSVLDPKPSATGVCLSDEVALNCDCVYACCLNVIRAYEEWTQKGDQRERTKRSQKSNGCTFGLAFPFRLVPDVPHFGSDLIRYDTHKYTSTRPLSRLLSLLLVLLIVS